MSAAGADDSGPKGRFIREQPATVIVEPATGEATRAAGEAGIEEAAAIRFATLIGRLNRIAPAGPSVETTEEASELLDAIAAEIRLRLACGLPIDLADYCRRFPRIEQELTDRFRRLDAETSRLTGGGFEFIDVIGRGGMGIVYKARQRSLDRIVAVKMLRDGLLSSPERVTRFRTEALAAARLKHPNIVSVFEIAEHSDRQPMLVMEYIDGVSLDRCLAREILPARQAAEIARQIAEALAAAHAAGIIHRDIKPANILLERPTKADSASSALFGPGPPSPAPPFGIWKPKIADFGLAKLAVEEAESTATGTVLGTPSYMSPEQARGRGEIGPPADVYSLGAVLYHCVAGRPPFRAATMVDTIELVLHAEPVPPRRIQPKLDRDLNTIVLRCLEKTPGRRYASAELLAQDLKRYLEGLPIAARPIRAWERCWKWARRRPSAAAAAGIAALAACLLLGTWVWLTAALRIERDRAAGEKQVAEQRYEQSKRSLQHARDAVRKLLVQVADDPEMKRLPIDSLRKRLAESAFEMYERIAAETDDDDVRFELANSYANFAWIANQFGLREQTSAAIAKQRAILEDLLQRRPDHLPYRRELAVVVNNLGHVAADPAESESLLRQAFDLYRQLIVSGDTDPNTEYRTGVAAANLANLLRRQNRRDEAAASFGTAIEYLERARQALPDVAAPAAYLAMARNNYGRLLEACDRLKEAEAEYLASIDLRQRLLEKYNEIEYVVGIGGVCHNLGILRMRQGDVKGALECLQRARDCRQTALSKHPDLPPNREALFRTCFALARTLRQSGKTEQAGVELDRAIDLGEGLLGEMPQVRPALAECLCLRAELVPAERRDPLLQKCHAVLADALKINPADSQVLALRERVRKLSANNDAEKAD